MNIAKAGWLQRESSFLHRWKKSWFVLFTNGHLMYYDSPDSREALDQVLLHSSCIAVNTGKECDFEPPTGLPKQCLMKLGMRGFDDWKLCAESPDDMSAWKMALEEARAANPSVNQPGQQVMYPHTMHGGYAGDVLMTGGQYVVHNAATGPGITSTVVVDDGYYGPYWGGRRYHRYGRRYGRPFYGPSVYAPILFW